MVLFISKLRAGLRVASWRVAHPDSPYATKCRVSLNNGMIVAC
jgi:hypothetical protein